MQVEFCCLHNALVLYLGFFGMQKLMNLKNLSLIGVEDGVNYTSKDYGVTIMDDGIWQVWGLLEFAWNLKIFSFFILVFSPFKMFSACIAQCALAQVTQFNIVSIVSIFRTQELMCQGCLR